MEIKLNNTSIDSTNTVIASNDIIKKANLFFCFFTLKAYLKVYTVMYKAINNKIQFMFIPLH